MKTVLSIAAVLTLSACAGSKPQVPYQPGAQFEVGKTTFQDVRKTLGEPKESTHYTDGSRSVHYFHSETQVNSRTDIPYMGTFPGGTHVESSFMSMKFSKEGILTQYSAISSKTTSGISPPSRLAGPSDP